MSMNQFKVEILKAAKKNLDNLKLKRPTGLTLRERLALDNINEELQRRG